MYDRFSDVSRSIYKNFPDFSETLQQQLLQSTKNQEETEDVVVKREEKETTESRPLNCKEVKPNLKQQKQLTPNVPNPNRNKKKTSPTPIRATKPEAKEEEELKPKINNLNNVHLDTSEYDKKEQEMKDLDRLVNDLLAEASQIPDYDADTRSIPYHARGDSLPFRYVDGDIVKLGGHSEVYLPTHQNNGGSKSSVHSHTEWNPLSHLREPESIETNSWNVVDTSAKTVPTTEQKLTAIPKNWNNSNNNLQQQQQRPRPIDDDYQPKTWTRVTVEHDEAPITWTRLTEPDYSKDSNKDRNNWSNNDHNISIPIAHEKSGSRADYWANNSQSELVVPIVREQGSRDWNVFQDVRQKEIELEERNRTKTKEPRRQYKYGRSFSADNFSDQDSDEWLAQKMAKLQLKRSASIRQQHPLINRQESAAATPAWLVELKQRTAKAKTIEESTSSNIIRNNDIPIAIESSESPVPEPELLALSSSTAAATPTPRFPCAPPTPYMNKSAARHAHHMESHFQRGRNATHAFSQRSAPVTDDDTEDEEEIAKIMSYNRKQEEELKFTVDTSSSWYKPSATRAEAIDALANRVVGTFIIRNSNSFPGAYGLAIKFDEDNVRHFLIEPTRAGVRLRGSSIEPVFSSLSALVYGHTIDNLALPVKLRLPDEDNLIPTSLSQSTTSKLLSQGAACQLLFLGSNSVEMLTGGEAIQRSVSKLFTNRPILVNLRLSKGGLVLTDIMRQTFFRNHHNLSSIIHAGIDPLNRSITVHGKLCKLFGIVVSSRNSNNNVLVLSEYEDNQPGTAIVSFIMRVIQWRS